MSPLQGKLLEILKLVHQSNRTNKMNNFFLVLAIGGLYLSNLFVINRCFSQDRVILSETFVFRVSNEVKSLSDLDLDKRQLISLKCFYPESITAELFPAILGSSEKKMTRETLSDFLHLVKLKKYVESYNTNLKKSTEVAFYLASRTDCNSRGFFNKKKKMNKHFRELILTELFLRKRYLITKKSSNTEKLKARMEIKTLLKTIDKQIESEVYLSI